MTFLLVASCPRLKARDWVKSLVPTQNHYVSEVICMSIGNFSMLLQVDNSAHDMCHLIENDLRSIGRVI